MSESHGPLKTAGTFFLLTTAAILYPLYEVFRTKNKTGDQSKVYTYLLIILVLSIIGGILALWLGSRYAKLASGTSGAMVWSIFVLVFALILLILTVITLVDVGKANFGNVKWIRIFLYTAIVFSSIAVIAAIVAIARANTSIVRVSL